MEITLNLDLHKILTEATSEEKLQPLVNKAINDAVTSAISHATGYSSDFRKQLEQQLKEALPHGLAIDDVAKFQHVLNSQISALANEANNATIATAMREAAARVVPDVPAVVKLSELINRAREGFHKEAYESFYAHLEESDYGSLYLYLDSDESPGSRTYDDSSKMHAARYRLSLNKEGECYSLKLDGTIIRPMVTPNIITRFDGLLMALYVGRTRIEFDIEADEVGYAAQAQED